MSTVYEFFSQDHRRCDELFVGLEQALGGGDWGLIEQRVGGFVSEMEHHFFMEEEELFPELEAQFAGAVGPTRMMRIEHRQMRSLFEQLQQCTERKNARDCQDVAETLLMTMQQHNAKELSRRPPRGWREYCRAIAGSGAADWRAFSVFCTWLPPGGFAALLVWSLLAATGIAWSGLGLMVVALLFLVFVGVPLLQVTLKRKRPVMDVTLLYLWSGNLLHVIRVFRREAEALQGVRRTAPLGLCDGYWRGEAGDRSSG